MNMPGSQVPIDHGTTAGAALHKKRKIPLCEPCRIARNAYEQERNEAIRLQRQEAVESALIRGRVLTRMAKAYPQVYARFMREELEKRKFELDIDA